MFSYTYLTDVEEGVARRIISVARTIAPCLDSLEGESLSDAVAILQGVVAELPDAGSRRMRSMSRNGTSISLADVKSAFSDDDRDSLRALCGAARSGIGYPVGSFPKSGIVRAVWPEVQS